MDQVQATRPLEGAIKTFIIDWPILSFIGLLFGAFAPTTDPWRSRAFKSAFVTGVAFTAAAFISYVVAPDWMWMYFLDPDAVAWSLPFIALAYLVTLALGFAAALGLRSLSRAYVFGAAAAALGAEVVILAITWERYRSVGTLEEWFDGTASPLLGTSPEGPVQVISPLGPIFAIIFVVALVWTLREHRAPSIDR